MLRAIVIKSNSMDMQQLITIIKSCGISVIDCFDKTKGVVKKVLALKPDVVFLDTVIGQMDGLMVGRRIRDGDNEIKLVFVANDGRYAAEAYNVGATDFLLNPIEKERVAMTFERVRK